MRKAWSYNLASLEQPTEIPFIIQAVLIGRAHLGETLPKTSATEIVPLLKEVHPFLAQGFYFKTLGFASFITIPV